jgi:hypothetical protein
MDQPTGIPVDRTGGPTIDPTANVLALVKAEAVRQDGLREAADRFNTAEIGHVKEMMTLRASQEVALRQADKSESSSIRQVDREDVNKTAAAAQTAIATLAKQTTDLATTLQKTLADTAIAVESRQSSFATEVNKRLSALELASSERIGKQQVYDPQAERINALVEKLASAQAVGTGKSEGSTATFALLCAIAGLILTLIIIGAFVFRQSHANGKLLKQR